MAQVVMAFLDGVSRVWDWTGIYEGPADYTLKNGDAGLRIDDKTAAAIYRDWVVVGRDMRRAMDIAGRSTVGQS